MNDDNELSKTEELDEETLDLLTDPFSTIYFENGTVKIKNDEEYEFYEQEEIEEVPHGRLHYKLYTRLHNYITNEGLPIMDMVNYIEFSEFICSKMKKY
jgi:hypothetical protein